MKQKVSYPECPKCGARIPEDAPESLCPKCLMSNLDSKSETTGANLKDMTPPDPDQLAQVFPEFEILELIGQGGMGFVFKVRQTKLDRIAALKLLPENLSTDPHFAERFNREARVLAKLNHPGIVTVFESGHRDPYYYFLMEYVDGVNLRQAMQAGKFSPREALKLVPQICEALQFAHDQKILHRDIKPENILLNEKGRIKIADFGIAKIAGQSDQHEMNLTQTGFKMGSPHYMAPEQFEKPEGIDHRADIYSLGVVFYEMLTGELPIGRFDPPSSRAPMDQTIDTIVLRALEKDRERRQKNADQMKTEIETLSVDGPRVQATKESRPSDSKFGAKIAVVSSALTTISLVCVLTLTAVLMMKGFDFILLLFLSLPLILCGIVGSVMGWIALCKLRNKQAPLEWKVMALLGSSGFMTALFPFAIAGSKDSPGLSVFGWSMTVVFGAFVIFVYSRTILRWLRSVRLFSWGELIIGIVLIFLLTSFVWPVRQSRQSQTPDPIVTGLPAKAGFSDLFQIDSIPKEYRIQDNSLEVIAVSLHPSSGKWWNVDGSEWEGEPFNNPGFHVGSRRGYRGVEIVTRVLHEAADDIHLVYTTDYEAPIMGGNTRLSKSKDLFDDYLIATEFPEELDQARLIIGAAMGPWETFKQTDQLALGTEARSVSWWPESLLVEFKGVEKINEESFCLSLSHNLEEMPYRVIAVEDNEIEHFSQKTDASSDDLTTVVFNGLQLNEVRYFRFQVLPYRWKVQDNIWLKPDLTGSMSGDVDVSETEITFSDIKVISLGTKQKFSIGYTVNRNGKVPVWTTSDESYDLKMGTLSELSGTTTENGTELITRKLELILPEKLTAEDLLKLLQTTQQNWTGRTLRLYPGDRHEVLVIARENSDPVGVWIQIKK